MRGYAAQQKAQCEVRSSEEDTVQRFVGNIRTSCRGTLSDRQCRCGSEQRYAGQQNEWCGDTQRNRPMGCGSVQFRHRRAAVIPRSLLVKLRTPFEIIIGCLLSIAAEFWV